MDDTQIQDQNKPNSNQDDSNRKVSVNVGGVEGAPVEVSSEVEPVKDLETTGEQVQSSEVQPTVSDDVKPYVKINRDTEVSQAAKDAGVQESIPTHPNYVPPVFSSVEEAEKVSVSSSTDLSIAWIAKEAAKQLKRALRISQPQEAQ